MVSVTCLGKKVLFQSKRDTCFIIMGGKVNYKCKSRMFYEMQKVEDSFKYTEMELGSMVLASCVLSLPFSVEKLQPKKKLNQAPHIKSHAKRTDPTLSAKRNWKFLRTFRNQFPHCGLLLFNLREIGMATHGRKSTLVKSFFI